MSGANYWRDVQKRMAAGGAYDHGVMDAHTVDPPAADAWDECGGCGHDRDDHHGSGCDVGTFHLSHGGWRPCECRGFQDAT